VAVAETAEVVCEMRIRILKKKNFRKQLLVVIDGLLAASASAPGTVLYTRDNPTASNRSIKQRRDGEEKEKRKKWLHVSMIP